MEEPPLENKNLGKSILFFGLYHKKTRKTTLFGGKGGKKWRIFYNGLFTKGEIYAIISRLLSRCTGGSMDRASDSGSEGWGFESLPVYHKRTKL